MFSGLYELLHEQVAGSASATAETPGHTASLRDRTCSTCFKTIPMSDIHRCKGCQIAVYCGRECQKADWERHKQVCSKATGFRSQWDEDHKVVFDHLLQQHRRTSKSDLRRREHELARAWFDVHLLSIQKAVIAAIQEKTDSSNMRAFRHYNRCLFIMTIRPRKDMGDNPATAFYVASANLAPVMDSVSMKVLGIEAPLDLKSRMYHVWAAAHGAATRYLALVPIICTYTDQTLYNGAPVFDPSPRAAIVLQARRRQPAARNRWLPTLKAMVLRGHMLGPAEEVGDVDFDAKMGELVKVGANWEWAALEPEDAKRLGYVEHPGVVG